ncbi:glycine zipper 2TM domain-containing protein [Aeromonas salmonicida]|uniref:glycine zipper 2TM domain-containing protein n=1 Tax=Aeromonas salmonicida TaxID=645 RepID=UPI00283A8D3E|nr:glycine zipper 2TM domain-containing protein [Aeromonas salmonicida]
MNKSMLAGVGIGVASVLALSAAASGSLFSSKPQFAEVLASKPVTETIKTPRQECRNVTVTHRKPVQDENKILGTVVGAALGGVLGNQFGGGSGSGKKVATAAGAVAGGYAGNQVQGNMQAGDTYTTTQQRCKTVQDSSTRTLGYDVTYRLAGQEGVIRMEKAPGATIPVKDGKLVIDSTQG